MISPGEKMIDWIECCCPVPEGINVGRYTVLLDFQQSIIRSVYNNSGKTVAGQGWVVPAFFELQFDAKDAAALKKSMTQLVTNDEKRAEQLRSMIDQKREPWRIGLFASYCMQMSTLQLAPYEEPPAMSTFRTKMKARA